jgi:Ni,Fe-hydrogenase I small subunit
MPSTILLSLSGRKYCKSVRFIIATMACSIFVAVLALRVSPTNIKQEEKLRESQTQEGDAY